MRLARWTVVLAGLLCLEASNRSDANAQPLRPGTPVMRSVEHIFNRVSLDPGPFRSIGYRMFIKGLTEEELFAVTTGLLGTKVNESNARFTHAEVGTLERTIPSPLLPIRPGDNGTTRFTRAHATHTMYYDPSPNRNWLHPASFETGQVVAIYELVEETDFIDLISGVGSGTALAKLTYSIPFTLVTGRTFDFAELGAELVADFQFQILSGLVSPLPQFPVVIADSGIWKVIQ